MDPLGMPSEKVQYIPLKYCGVQVYIRKQLKQSSKTQAPTKTYLSYFAPLVVTWVIFKDKGRFISLHYFVLILNKSIRIFRSIKLPAAVVTPSAHLSYTLYNQKL